MIRCGCVGMITTSKGAIQRGQFRPWLSDRTDAMVAMRREMPIPWQPISKYAVWVVVGREWSFGEALGSTFDLGSMANVAFRGRL